MSRVPLGKVLLRNVIRHTDAHNKDQPQTGNRAGADAVHEERNPEPPLGAEEPVPEDDTGGEQRPETEPLTQPCHDSEAKLGAPAAGGEESWKQQQRQLGKEKHRRRPSKKKRHWKPYYKLTWEEKRKFDEKQSLRASRVRAEMFAKGQPVAPYNTTQFLWMITTRRSRTSKPASTPSGLRPTDTSDEEFMEEAGEEDGGSEFLQRDFSETYERFHAESLQNMSKQELIREYLELETCLSRMEGENNRSRLESKWLGGCAPRTCSC
ncbi:Protein HEXIM1 [Myotis davidii]|uniref:Protein HEXIM1 n=1 Tax=Myotis davidii TaxID=225400 RepID=L5M0M0_MYODS|nr:Protein HEXIM1 [Myotis davidii]